MEENGGDDEALPLVRVLAAVLDRLVATNQNHPTKNITKFSAAKRPAISIYDYLMRIHLYGRCSPSCFVLGLVYIDRLIQRDGFVLVGLNVHRVVITSLMIAAKFFDDFYFNNAFYARVGGIGTVEINELEVDFLRRLEYSLHVTTEEFERYSEELLVHAEIGPEEEEIFGKSLLGSSFASSSSTSSSKHHDDNYDESQSKRGMNDGTPVVAESKQHQVTSAGGGGGDDDEHKSHHHSSSKQHHQHEEDEDKQQTKPLPIITSAQSKDSSSSSSLSSSYGNVTQRNHGLSKSSSPTSSTSSTSSSVKKRSSLRLSWPSAMSAWYAPIASVLPSRIVSKT